VHSLTTALKEVEEWCTHPIWNSPDTIGWLRSFASSDIIYSRTVASQARLVSVWSLLS